jgi:hypothetical protein
MSKAKDFMNEAEVGSRERIVTLEVKMRIKPKGPMTPSEVMKAAQAALLTAIPEEDLKYGETSMYVISVKGTKAVMK